MSSKVFEMQGYLKLLSLDMTEHWGLLVSEPSEATNKDQIPEPTTCTCDELCG